MIENIIDYYVTSIEVIDELYLIVSALFLIAGVGAIWYAYQQESEYQKNLVLLTSIPAFVFSIAYVGLAYQLLAVDTGVREQSVIRFFGYTAVILILVYLFNEAINLSKRQSAIALGLLLVYPWGTLASWVTPGAISSALTGLVLLAYLTSIYYLTVPMKSVMMDAKLEEALFYSKLRNLTLFVQGCLVIAAALSPQAIGIMSNFAAQHASAYADLWLIVGTIYLTATTLEFYHAKGV